ncbi:MAG: sulfur carrier protein ThiS [Bacteroidetes bacterium]|nr:sulfur carrier protein ThiS [Bacteroidota bacterium]
MEITSTVGQIVVNGESREVPVDVTIDALLSHLGRDPEMPGVAVAVNDTVVRRADWTKTMLNEGDHVEIITASQGG